MPGPLRRCQMPLSSALGRPCSPGTKDGSHRICIFDHSTQETNCGPLVRDCSSRWVAGGPRAWRRCVQRAGGPRALPGPVPPARDWVRGQVTGRMWAERPPPAPTAPHPALPQGHLARGPSARDLGPSAAGISSLACLSGGAQLLRQPSGDLRVLPSPAYLGTTRQTRRRWPC